MSHAALHRFARIVAAALLITVPARASLAVSFGFVPDSSSNDSAPGPNERPHMPPAPASPEGSGVAPGARGNAAPTKNAPAKAAPAKAAPAKTAPADAAPANPENADTPPPYEPQLLRLSELLGALTYLQDLCGPHQGDVWRAKMAALLDAEAKTPLRKERLAGAFNRGFQGYALTYRLCTANAQAIIGRYLSESGEIAHDVSRRYGPS